jgi:hypothetical protein
MAIIAPLTGTATGRENERMSQITELTPAAMLKARVQQLESRVKAFEWTWTTSVVFSVGVVFFLVITTSVIPSFWLYFADSKLKWNGAGQHKLVFITLTGFWLKEIRDAVAMGLATGPIITLLVGAAIMQNWRRKLRGQTQARPTGGYR